jgi:AI-2 transport protein TqsA
VGDRLTGLLQAAACAVVVCWGIRSASHILSVVLIALLLTYAIMSFPQWLMRRFRLSKSTATLGTVLFVIAIYSIVTLALLETGAQMREKLPLYESRMQTLHAQISGSLARHGIQATEHSVKELYSSERIVHLVQEVLPGTIALFSDRILIWLLSILFLIEILEPDGGVLGRNLNHYGGDVQRFITISAKTGAINALANLVFMVILGVDFPVVWCLVYFFLHFIPNVGFLVSLIPPTLIALLMHGWKRALLMLGALILTEMLGDYVLKPLLMKKGLHISMLEIMLSLTAWSFLLGPTGAILAIPLTMALRRFIESPLNAEAASARASS